MNCESRSQQPMQDGSIVPTGVWWGTGYYMLCVQRVPPSSKLEDSVYFYAQLYPVVYKYVFYIYILYFSDAWLILALYISIQYL